jgi:hypothetical protein
VIHRAAVGALVAGQLAVLAAGGSAAAFLAQPASWSVAIAESRATDRADEVTAAACGRLPGVSEFSVYLSLPGQIVVSGKGGRQRANRVAACLEHVPHMRGRAAVRFTPAHLPRLNRWHHDPDTAVPLG